MATFTVIIFLTLYMHSNIYYMPKNIAQNHFLNILWVLSSQYTKYCYLFILRSTYNWYITKSIIYRVFKIAEQYNTGLNEVNTVNILTLVSVFGQKPLSQYYCMAKHTVMKNPRIWQWT